MFSCTKRKKGFSWPMFLIGTLLRFNYQVSTTYNSVSCIQQSVWSEQDCSTIFGANAHSFSTIIFPINTCHSLIVCEIRDDKWSYSHLFNELLFLCIWLLFFMQLKYSFIYFICIYAILCVRFMNFLLFDLTSIWVVWDTNIARKICLSVHTQRGIV